MSSQPKPEHNNSDSIQNLTVNKVVTNGSKQSAGMRGNVQEGGEL